MLFVCFFRSEIEGNNEAKRLLSELMKDYNRYVLPVQSINQKVNVTLGLKLSQLSDIDERNQIMTTNVWLEHVKSILCTRRKKRINRFRTFRNGRIIN